MNKIYSDQIEKAHLLIDGLNKNRTLLASKGYDLSVIEKLKAECQAMQKEGEAIAIEEAQLSEHRTECHIILDRLKTLISEGKSGIKTRFDQEKWLQYGVPDKR